MESLGFDKKNKLALGLLDSLKDGEIKFPEFVDMMTARVSDSENKDDIAKVFRLFDEDETGRITIANLRRVAKELGETVTDDELKEMIDRGDLNKTGSVELDDFMHIMTKKHAPAAAAGN